MAEPIKSKGKRIVTSIPSDEENILPFIKRVTPLDVKSSKAGPTIPPKNQLCQTQGDKLRAALAENDDSEDEMPADLTVISDFEGTLFLVPIPQFSFHSPSLTLSLPKNLSVAHTIPSSTYYDKGNPSALHLLLPVLYPLFTNI